MRCLPFPVRILCRDDSCLKKIISQSFHEIENSLLDADLAGCQKIPGSKFPKRLIRARLVLTERLENLLFRKSLKIWGLERQLQLLLEISLFLLSVLINRSVEIPTLTDSCSIFFRFLKLGRNFFRSFFHEEVRQFFSPSQKFFDAEIFVVAQV